MNEIEKLSLQNVDHNSEYNLFDIIFFAWKYKVTYLIKSLIVGGITGIFLLIQSPPIIHLKIVISSPQNNEAYILYDFELKCRDYMLESTCGLISPATLHERTLEIINYDKKKYNIIKTILSNRISDKDLEYIIVEAETDIDTISKELAGNLKHAPVPNVNGSISENLTQLILSHNDKYILNLISPHLIHYINKMVIEEFYIEYDTIVKFINSDRDYNIKKLNREIDIITQNKVASISLPDQTSTLFSEEEFNPFFLTMQKKLELSEWVNIDIPSFESLLQSKHLLSSLSQNKSYHETQSSTLVSTPKPKKKFLLIALLVASIFVFLNIVIDIEIKKRKKN